MPDLVSSDQHGALHGHLFTGKLVRGGARGVSKAKLVRGSWGAKVTMFIRLLMFAYRMGRPVNLVEAFHPLSPGELGVM
ncbi:unnamed protein product [Ectocarpus sp. 12 AP-2014]